MKLAGKHILVGVSAGIAAYKICELVRLFKKAGAAVTCVMTPNAEHFVSPLVLATLSQNKVYKDQFDYKDYEIEHISLTDRADILVLAPATANTISKIANGICDNLLTSTVCAFSKTKIIVPAMNVNMYENPIIQENLNKLEKLGYIVLQPEIGELACGVVAKGKMISPESIFEKTSEYLMYEKKSKKVLITTGGTKENIDPVRYIGNYSSGKMGIALADEAYSQGYDVTLVSTVDLEKPYCVLKVQTAQEMLECVQEQFVTSDALIMAAAVADYRPLSIAEQKIKKEDTDGLTIKLVKNPDILKEISKIKKNHQIVIGFCAESENLIANAQKKIIDKKLDFIAANDISRSDIGFNSDFNEINIFSKDGKSKLIEKTTKREAAKIIISECLKF